MEPKELEKNLAEIEERLDRVRALYEQYFCGIEKVEPQVPRKDLDRRIVMMRKEQIRNTAMRFKFQTLVQRYNTLQQHWGRIIRDIENGTFKRDLARAAARFGVEDALTAVGRKRAERLAKGIEAQASKLQARRQMQRDERGDDFDEVSDADIEDVDDFDDEAPTPPPISIQQPGAVPGAAPIEGPSASPPDPRPRVGFFPGMRVQPAAAGRTEPSGGFGVPISGLGDETYSGTPAPRVPAQPQPAPPPPAPGSAVAPPPAVGPPDAGAPRAKGGLRLGGGPSKRASSEALSRIASSLVPDSPAASSDGAGTRRDELARGAAPAAPDGPPVAAPAGARRPLLSRPLGLDDLPPSEPKPSDPRPAELTRPPASTRPTAAAAPIGGLRPPPGGGPPAPRAQPTRAQGEPPGSAPQRSAPRKEDLSPDRLREIYTQYVQTRRDRNESTAGITYEKLADSLKAQADKLREKHAAKKVDYEVVVKDGKTLIKPIVR
jgi:hypothetical protein